MTKKIKESFLNKAIQEIIQNAFAGKNICPEMDKLKCDIEKKLSDLHTSGDLRVFDNDNGGVLRGPVNSRKKREEIEQNGLKYRKVLHCKQEYMTHCKKNYMIKNQSNGVPSEVPYMRALFNSSSIGTYDLIAYEMPLMRKCLKNANPDISGREVSCDLLGMDTKNNELCCIEVKTDPDSNATKLPYALIEGFAYSVCLNWIRKEEPALLFNEIKLCCKDFGFANPVRLPERITFAIAGPFENYFNPYITGKLTGHTDEWFRRRMLEIESIEKCIFSRYKELFSGYMILSPSITDVDSLKTNKTGIIKPIFTAKNMPKLKITKSFSRP